jgi:hypothetical protein
MKNNTPDSPTPWPTRAYTAGTPVTQISFRTWNQNKSWHYERIIKMGDHKLRINGRHNAYQQQSYISVERWDGSQWQHMQTIAGAAMNSWNVPHGRVGAAGLYVVDVLPDTLLHAFESDEDELVEAAAAILL